MVDHSLSAAIGHISQSFQDGEDFIGRERYIYDKIAPVHLASWRPAVVQWHLIVNVC